MSSTTQDTDESNSPITTINEKTGLTASKRVSWADSIVKDSPAPSVSTQSLDSSNQLPLSLLQERFLRWHVRCNHSSFANMMKLARKGLLPKEFLQLANDLPPCASCLFGKQTRCAKRMKTGKPIRQKEHKNYPGGGVSTDQIISTQPGLLPQDISYWSSFE